MLGNVDDVPHVLVVDDNPRILDAVGRAIARAHPRARVHTSVDAAHALEKVREERSKGQGYDWVLVDHHLGAALRGLDLVRILAVEAPETGVVLMSGDPEVEALAKKEDAVKRFLRKPFRARDVVAVLQA